MINNGNSLSERRKRGTGLTERTNVSLSPRAFQLKEDNKLNLSALVEKMILEKFGDVSDPVIGRMIVKRDQLVEQVEDLRQEITALNSGIAARQSSLDEMNREEESHSKHYAEVKEIERKVAEERKNQSLEGLKEMEDLT